MIINEIEKYVKSSRRKKEIEENVTEKFTGVQNAGRTVIAFNDDKDHQTTIAKIPSDDFDKKYETLRENSREVLFASYKATPALFGIPTDDKGFAEEQYEEQFKLFNRTVIRPIQKNICNAVDKIVGGQANLIIKPFSINWDSDTEKTVE